MTHKNILQCAKTNSTECAKFCAFDFFHYLSKVWNSYFYQNRTEKKWKKKRKEKKEKNITGKQILKSSYITHLTLKTSNVGYAYCNPSVTWTSLCFCFKQSKLLWLEKTFHAKRYFVTVSLVLYVLESTDPNGLSKQICNTWYHVWMLCSFIIFS